MLRFSQRISSFMLASALSAALLFSGGALHAQTAAPPGAAGPAAPGGPPPPPPESLIPDGEAPPMRSVPPAFPPAIPNIDYGARLRTALMAQSAKDPSKMDGLGQMLEGDLYMNGQVHRYFAWQFAITFAYPGKPGSPNTATFAPLDVIAKFEPLKEFNIYAGRMLVQADRFTPGGPWGLDEFFYPGFFPLVGAPALPKAGPQGRDVGVTVWGAPFDGHFKYYVGAFQLHDPALKPLFTGRLQLSLLSPEPAFYQRTTYFGTKDLVSFGVGAQYQAAGSVQPVAPPAAGMPPVVPLTDDFSSVTGDVNVEKILGSAGTVSAVGQVSSFQGDYQRWRSYWVASLGYLMPKPIGIGKIRGTIRYQSAIDPSPGAKASTLIDAQVSYNVAAWYARVALGFRHGSTYLPGAPMVPGITQDSNMAYLGITLADP
ncbi:MAG TPA: hypothetical protein VHM70_10825 [Polyangiaceae bacterium]|nr:hypothetical protein [Polyangiaceae bacterium]